MYLMMLFIYCLHEHYKKVLCSYIDLVARRCADGDVFKASVALKHIQSINARGAVALQLARQACTAFPAEVRSNQSLLSFVFFKYC